MKNKASNITVAAITRVASVDFEHKVGSFDVFDTFIKWAEEFDTKNAKTNWEKVDYEDAIFDFVQFKIQEEG